MKKVTKIDANTTDFTDQTKLRVAAYCRVSTDSDEQLDSLDAQMKHYESDIKANPSWEFAGLYYDEGISGTKKEKRHEFMRLIADCEDGKVDRIVTKSISRFARNTMDCLEIVRKFNSIGISVFFEKENLDTDSMESELMLSILSRLAEEESKSIAENNRWSVQRRFENGTFKISCPPFGYDAVGGELVVNEQQAEAVRFVFAELLSGKSTQKIADELNRRQIPTRNGRLWTGTTVRGMIGNEKYTGDALFQKTYSDSDLNRRVNRGERDQYFIRNNHAGVITHSDFEAAQSLIEQRGREKGVVKQPEKYRNRYSFSGIIICGQCGGTFKRRTHSAGSRTIAWCCKTHIDDIDRCSMKFILDEDLKYAFVTMMNKLIFGYKAVLKPLYESLRGMKAGDSLERIEELNTRLIENAEQRKVLIGLLTKGYLEPAVFNKGNNDLMQEAERLQRQKDSLEKFMSSDSQHLDASGDLLKYTSKAEFLTGFDGDLFKRFVHKVHVYNRTDFGFELKCGITLKERAGRE